MPQLRVPCPTRGSSLGSYCLSVCVCRSRFFIEGIPIAVAAALIVLHCLMWTWKYFVFGQRAKGVASLHAHGFLGSYLMLIFYM